LLHTGVEVGDVPGFGGLTLVTTTVHFQVPSENRHHPFVWPPSQDDSVFVHLTTVESA
jgi:hypothetical protein